MAVTQVEGSIASAIVFLRESDGSWLTKIQAEVTGELKKEDAEIQLGEQLFASLGKFNEVINALCAVRKKLKEGVAGAGLEISAFSDKACIEELYVASYRFNLLEFNALIPDIVGQDAVPENLRESLAECLGEEIALRTELKEMDIDKDGETVQLELTKSGFSASTDTLLERMKQYRCSFSTAGWWCHSDSVLRRAGASSTSLAQLRSTTVMEDGDKSYGTSQIIIRE